MSPQTSRDSTTATRILAAACRALGSDNAASMEMIAAEAGVSRATVHRHFDTRDALISAAGAWAGQEIEAAFHSGASANEPMVIRLFGITRSLLQAKSSLDAVLRAYAGDNRAREDSGVFAEALTLITELKDAGFIAGCADDRWAAHSYLGLLRIAAHEAVDDPAAINQRASLVLDTFLHGVGITSVRYSD